MPTISSLTDDINRLSESISRWNTAIIVLMVLAALAATGLVIAQRIAFKKADRLADLTEQRAKLDSAAKDLKIGEANDRAAQADLKRVQLQNRIVNIFGVRHMTEEQSGRIANKLAGLGGAKIDVYVLAIGNPYSADDSEDSENIGRTVVNALRAPPALIDAEGSLLEDCHGSGASNVFVSVALPSSDADREIATRVQKALQPEIETDPEISDQTPSCTKFSDLDKSRPNKRNHDAAISITIGRKINPLLTREMLEPDDKEKVP